MEFASQKNFSSQTPKHKRAPACQESIYERGRTCSARKEYNSWNYRYTCGWKGVEFRVSESRKNNGVGRIESEEGVSPILERLLKKARGSLANGDDGLFALAAYKDEIPLLTSVDLLERACAYGTGEIVEKMFSLFGGFEYCTMALALALAAGKKGSAIALLKRGVTLERPTKTLLACPEDRRTEYEQRGSAYYVVHSGFLQALETRRIFRIAHSAERTAELLRELRETELLTVSDAQALVVELIGRGGKSSNKIESSEVWHDCTRELIDYVRYRERDPVEVGGCPTVIDELTGLLRPVTGTKAARLICAYAPHAPNRVWTEEFLRKDSESLKVMIPFLDPQRCEDRPSLIRILAENGWVEELEIVLKWPGTFEGMLDVSALNEALLAASENGHVEVAAYLLDCKTKLPADRIPDVGYRL